MRIEYDKIAATYDDHRKGGGPYLDHLVTLARRHGAQHVLELGPGTGNNTQAFLDAYPCRLTGLELSRGMIKRARAKPIPAQWVQGTATNIPLRGSSAEFVFGVYVLHHLPDLRTVFQECARVLGSGCAAFVTATHDFIGRHPMNRYFPSLARIDRARFQSLDDVEKTFRQCGFSETGAAHFADAPRPIGPEYVERVASKIISTYHLISSEEFSYGLSRLRADVEKTGRLDVDMVWESVAVWGRK